MVVAGRQRRRERTDLCRTDVRVRVICPHAGPPHPLTLLSLAAWWDHEKHDTNPIEYIDTSTSDTAYAELIMHLWKTSPDGFNIIEQDMGFRPEELDALLECECAYGALPYAWTTNIGPALGATKFGAELLTNVPAPSLAGTHYRQVDIAVLRIHLGQHHHRQPHLHLPPIQHLNERQALRPEFQHLTLAEHLAALGYEIAEDGLTAEYTHPTFEFGELPAST